MYAKKNQQVSSLVAFLIALHYEQAYRQTRENSCQQGLGLMPSESGLQLHLIPRPVKYLGQPPLHGNPPPHQPLSEESTHPDSTHDGGSHGDDHSHGAGEPKHGHQRHNHDHDHDHDHDGHHLN